MKQAAFAAFQMLTRPLTRRARARKEDFVADEIRSILVYKPDHLGDLLLAAPAVAALKEAFPAATITLAARKQGHALYGRFGLVDDFVPFDGVSLGADNALAIASFLGNIRRRRFDLVVNLRHDFREILFAQSLGERFLCTYNHRDLAVSATYAVTPSVDCYEAENHLALVATLGAKAARWAIPVSDAAQKKAQHLLGKERWIVLHPAARTAAKQWPIESFAMLARKLRRREYAIACVGDRSDRDRCAPLLESRNVDLDLVGKASFDEMFAVMSGASLFIGIDSFPMHAAYFCGTPQVAVFSGTNRPDRWAPPGCTVIQNPMPCTPCALETCKQLGHPCMRGISVDRVFEAAIDRLRQNGGQL